MTDLIYTVGASSKCDIVRRGRSVAEEHLRVRVLNEKQLLVEDLESEHGAFRNGRRFAKATIEPRDMIRLGRQELPGRFLFDEVSKLKNEGQADFTEYFQQLKPAFDQYKEERNTIDTKLKRKAMLPRVIITLTAMIIGITVAILSDNNTARIIAMTAGTSVAVIAGFVSPSRSDEKKAALDKLRSEQQRKLACPKCHTTLVDREWGYWYKTGTCPNSRCTAIFRDVTNSYIE